MMDVTISGPVGALIELVVVEADGTEGRTTLWGDPTHAPLAEQMIAFGGPAHIGGPQDVVLGRIEFDEQISIDADGATMTADVAGDRMAEFLIQAITNALSAR